MANALNAAYGHGVRKGMLLAKVKTREGIRRFVSGPNAAYVAPHWFTTPAQRFCWRQGVKNGAGAPTLLSTLTVMLIGE